jgi:hypothetical protein
MNAQLEQPRSERASITEVPQSHTRDALSDPVACRPISKTPEPIRERLTAVRTGIDTDILLYRHPARVALKLLRRHSQTGSDSLQMPGGNRVVRCGSGKLRVGAQEWVRLSARNQMVTRARFAGQLRCLALAKLRFAANARPPASEAVPGIS